MSAQIFISHISEEAGAAARLKATLTNDFLGLLEVFVSSDTESIAAGAEWLTSISHALRESRVFLVLCSPTSILRPWINFEAGAAWMHGVLPATVCNVLFFPSTLSFFDLVPFQNDCERCDLISKTALFALLPHPKPS